MSAEGTSLPPPVVPARSLGARALDGLRWGGVSVALNVALQLGFTAALARLLDPAAFGLMAMCTVALRLFTYFAQLGMAAALVQKERLEEQDIRCALGLTWLVCSAAIACILAVAPLAAWFFRSEPLVAVLRALAPSLLLQGLGGVSTALLRRDLRFREQAVVEVAAYGGGFGLVGVTTAWAGAGVWSLVAATYAHALLTWVVAWALVRHPLRPSLEGARSRLLGYGARHSTIGLLEFLSGSVDTAVIGRLLGDGPLGLYNRAVLLANQPVEKVSSLVARVLFPLLSTVQGERRKVGAAFLLGLALVGGFGGAVSVGLAAAAADAVRVVLGERWGGTAEVVAVIAYAVPFLFMSQIAGSVCDALALLRFKLRVQGGALVVITALLAALSPFGLRGVAWAIVAGEVLRFAVYARYLSRELECRPGEVARVLGGVAATAVLAHVACAGASAGGAALGLPPLATLGLDVVAGAVALAAGALVMVQALDGTEPARLAEASVPGWRRFRAALRFTGAGA